MADPFIITDKLTYSYDDDEGNPSKIPALLNVSIQINEGEYVAVLGHNGSGKSTFAKLLNMILEPTFGRIIIDGTDLSSDDITEDDIYELRRRVGMVFQNPDNQLVATIVEEDVAFGPENLGIPSDEIRKRVDDALATVGISEYAKHEPHRLSGGQKQRVAIAGILAMQPKCMIFDESTAMLDPVGRREVLDTIKKLNKEQNITVINITHYMEEAVLADRVIVINDGEILIDGTPAEVFSKPDLLRSVGLAVPQCTDLIQRLRAKGIKLEGDDITDLEACADMICEAFAERQA